MIDRTHAVPVVAAMPAAWSWRARRPTINRSRSLIQQLTLMRRIDELHLQYPFAGARMLRDLLRHEGHAIGRRQCGHPDASHGDHRGVSQARHHVSGIPLIGSIPISCASLDHHSPEPCLGGGYYLHSDETRASSICSLSWTGRVVGCWRGGSPIR